MRNSLLIATLIAPVTVAAQSIDEEALMRATFAELNPISIEQNVEFCGYLGFTAEGELAISPPTRGDESRLQQRSA